MQESGPAETGRKTPLQRVAVRLEEVQAPLPEDGPAAALVSTDLAKTLNNEGSYTVFAPTNAAFDAAAQALLGDESATGLDLLLTLDKETLSFILLYHVVPGKLLSGDVLASDTFTTANGDDINRDGTTILGGQGSAGNLVLDLIDIEASNGVVHVIDGVLLPPVQEDPQTIVEIAAGNPAFSTLVAAVQKAGLVDILSQEKYKFTVFAPVNDAFDAAARVALNDENATGLQLVDALSEENQAKEAYSLDALSRWELRRILFNHLLWGERDSEFVLSYSRFYTLAWSVLYREDLTLTSRNGQGTLIPELIDIEASNGIIHVVDGVLLP